MTEKVLQKTDIPAFLIELMKTQKVVAPMVRDNTPAEFRELKAGDAPIIDGSAFMTTPKEYLLPRYEPMIKVRTGEDGTRVESLVPESEPWVMLGVWLPDAQATQVLDKVFLDEKFRDPYYAARRDGMTTVAVVPSSPRWSWFCAATDDVNGWKQSADVITYDLGDSLYFEAVTEKGEALLKSGPFADPDDAARARRDEVWKTFTQTGCEGFSGDSAFDRLLWESPLWAEIADKCVSCGACTYVCPSCSCFDVQDETSQGCVTRYRCRDTCQFCDFTLMGHGHNPRHNQVPRSRQRLMHKFKYQREQFGLTACTGCGRCVELCPVNVDVRDVLTRTCAVSEA